ncbi:hypothetical protein FRB96_000813 [Tulasnella sp. 330]|nr:hypothetical protein FRB96_000813 [Tulasnella sp. 330]KAG8881942.1 hypothetical protein FRB97_008900 [Tulasnella sp. 331]
MTEQPQSSQSQSQPQPAVRRPWAILHDHCRVQKIPLDIKENCEGPQDVPKPRWTATITLNAVGSPEARVFIGGVDTSKKAARDLAAEVCLRELGLSVSE